MQKNCGILAFDRLVGMLNGRSNAVSLDTLSKLAQDNKFLLYPMKVPRIELSKIQFPYVVNLDNHFEVWEDETAVDVTALPEEIYILSSQLFPEFVVEEDEAKEIKGGKKFSQIMGALAPALIGIATGGLGGLLGLGTTMAPLVGAGAGALAGGLGAGVGGPEHGGILPAVTGGLGGYGGTSLLQGLTGAGAAGAAGTVAGTAALKTAAGTAASGVPAILGGAPSNIIAGAAAQGLVPAATTIAPALTAAAPTATAGLLGGINKNLLLGGLGLLGTSTLPQTPEFQMPPDVQEMINQLRSGQMITPTGQIAATELQRIITSPFGQIYPDVTTDPYMTSAFRQIDEAGEEERDRINNYYDVYGTSYSGEHLAELSDLEDRLRTSKEDLSTKYAAQQRTEEINLRTQAIAQALNVDQTVVQELLGLTGLTVEAAATRYGAAVADVQSLRELLGTAGGLLTAGGLGAFQSPFATTGLLR